MSPSPSLPPLPLTALPPVTQEPGQPRAVHTSCGRPAPSPSGRFPARRPVTSAQWVKSSNGTAAGWGSRWPGRVASSPCRRLAL